MTASDPRELLSALLDREPVDADALAALLEDPEARALFVDFVRLRSALTEDAGAPSVSPRPARRAWTVGRTAFQIAAALLLVVLGAVAGRRIGTGDPDAPPEPTRVVKLVPVRPGLGVGR